MDECLTSTAGRRWIRAAGAVVVAGIVLYRFDPAGTTAYPPCPFRALTGLHCPGCGSLRATHQLLHGHVVAALRLNPLMVLSLPLLAGMLVPGAVAAARGRPAPRRVNPASWIWLALGVIVAYWILRNVPAYPFSLLAPRTE